MFSHLVHSVRSKDHDFGHDLSWCALQARRDRRMAKGCGKIVLVGRAARDGRAGCTCHIVDGALPVLFVALVGLPSARSVRGRSSR